MNLISPHSIPAIDAYAMQVHGVSEETLIRRVGDAVAKEILSRFSGHGVILVLCGSGNNGADGYATALALRKAGANAVAADVLERGQRSEGGQAVLAEYQSLFGAPLTLRNAFASEGVSVIVDAVLGSGSRGALSDDLRRLLKWVKRQEVVRVAIDIPLGVDADLGEVVADAFAADITIVPSFLKRGLLSYPARGFCGELVLADIGMGEDSLYSEHFSAFAADGAWVKAMLPKRMPNSHKGSFGKLHVFSGSKKMRGAAHLATHAALRMGVGLVKLTTEEDVVRMVGRRLPELLFDSVSPISEWSDAFMREMAEEADRAAAILIGPGSGVSEALYRFITLLAWREGPPLLLDADALGSIAAYADGVDAFFRKAKRPLALTPHPLEFARLIGMTTAQVQAARMRLALTYAKKWGVALLLKGAGTLITDGDALYINTTGSTALAKGGSGDVLAGAVAALLAEGMTPMHALAVAAYLHGAAGDSLAAELSEYGVLPSDLPLRMAQLTRML